MCVITRNLKKLNNFQLIQIRALIGQHIKKEITESELDEKIQTLVQRPSVSNNVMQKRYA